MCTYRRAAEAHVVIRRHRSAWLVPFRRRSGGPGGDLAAVVEAELGEDVLDVVFRGAFGDVEQVGDLAVGEAAADQFGDFALAPGEAAGPGAAGPQGLGKVPGIGSQAPHAE